MRRLLALLAAALLAGVAVAVPASEGDSDYELDVIFDDSRGLLVGQLVQVAGARVGQITDVTLTRDHKARIHTTIDRRFAPFRENATCTIKPSGLIAENYVQCDPGTPDAPPLEPVGDESPTVRVENTTQPVSLTDLFEVWNTPTQQRLTVLLSTLGIATSARGQDLNQILRRANPALQEARRVIAALEAQREDLGSIVDDAGAVVAELAERPQHVRGLERHAARVLTETAGERAALAEGLQRLPGLLERTRPALAQLDALGAAATPLLEDAEAAAPDLNAVSADIPRLAAAARPTLAALGPVLRRGAATARRTAPLTKLVASYARASLPTTRTAAAMFTALEERDFTKNLAAFFYYAALATARFDDQGHIIPAHVTLSFCGQYATTPDPDCGATTAAPARRKRAGQREERVPEPEATPRPQATPTPSPTRVPKLPVTPKLPELPPLDELLPDLEPGPTPVKPLDDLLDYLLG